MGRRRARVRAQRLRKHVVDRRPFARDRRMSRTDRMHAGFAAAVAAALGASGCSPSTEDRLEAEWELVGRYCADCHNDIEFAGDLSLERAVHADVAAHPERWERVVKKLRGDLMPPPGAQRPDGERIDALVAALEAKL